MSTIALSQHNKSLMKALKIALYVFLAVFAFIQLYPFMFLLFFSLKSNQEIFGGNIAWIPKKFIWENYLVAFTKGNVGLYFFNSVLVTTATTLLTVIVSSMATFAIIRMKWRFSGHALTLFLVGLMIPVHVSLLPLYMLFRNLKLLNTYWCLILPYVGFAMPMAIYILSGFMRSIPRELEESAVLDGCNIYQVFWHIIVPMLRPAVMTVTIFTFLTAWNELMFAITFISKTQFRTLTVGLQQMVGQYMTTWGPIGAGLVIATIPTLAIYSVLSGEVQKSFISGALKG